jgi:hypothetical protein
MPVIFSDPVENGNDRIECCVSQVGLGRLFDWGRTFALRRRLIVLDAAEVKEANDAHKVVTEGPVREALTLLCDPIPQVFGAWSRQETSA